MNSGFGGKCSLVRNERILHGAMVSVLVIGIVGASAVRNSLNHSIERIKAATEECKDLCKTETEVLDTVEVSQNRKEKLVRAFQSTLARIPANVTDSEVLSNVRGMVTQTRCSLVDFRPSSTIDHKDYHCRAFDLHLEGSFKSVYQFLEELSRSAFVLQVSRLKILEASAPGGACRVEMELRTVVDHVWNAKEQL